MSGDGHTNETRELNLDAIEARAERAHRQKERLLDAFGPTHQEAALLRSAMDVPALVAEVRRLRTEREQVRAIASMDMDCAP